MFVRAFTLVLAIVASAIAVPGDTSSECDTGSMQCCDQTMEPSSAAGVLGLLDLSSIQGLVALDCNPIGVGVIGSGAECNQQAVCCNNYQDNGNQVIGISCSPVNVNA